MAKQIRLVSDGGAFTGEESWRGRMVFTRDGIKDCRENVIYILNGHPAWKGSLAADVFARRIVAVKETPLGHKPGDEWGPDDLSRMGVWLWENEQLNVRKLDTMAEGVGHVAKEHRIHPLQDFLNALAWDGVPRIDSWLATYTGASGGEYATKVGRYFLLNLIRRAFEPGCVMRSVLVLEGAQNIGKSTIARMLAAPWFSDTPFRVGDKDAYQVLQGNWVYEISELDSFSRAEASAVKAFISSTKDRFRAPYERSVADHLRQVCFIATTNAVEYLKDWTGNTRFWPLRCTKIDLDGFAKVRDQLLAESVAIYRAGGAITHPDADEDARLFDPERSIRMSVHPWFDITAKYLRDNQDIRSVTVNEMLDKCFSMSAAEMGRDAQAEQRVGRALQKLGWTKKRDSTPDEDGTRARRWHRPEPKAEVEVDDVPVPF